MIGTQRATIERWPLQQAMLFLAGCLMAGVAGGWLIREWKSSTVALPTSAASAPAAAVSGTAAATQATEAQVSDPARLKAVADAEAAPLLVKLQLDPSNPDVLVSLGDLYYDAKQYSTAIVYYGGALKGRPTDAAVRTDMGTAYWYLGNADAALLAFNQALTYEPNNPNTLFNRGLVRWQGKKDSAGALADWKQLLAANPNYTDRNNVEQMIAQVQSANPAGSSK
jgi:tetratricopeptide (TPR) repeat protein